MKFTLLYVLILSVLSTSFTIPASKIYSCNTGTINFVSEAPLEVIRAKTEEMKGAINADERTFLFSVNVNSFHGFNSGLQREHFNENYLETAKYPRATFEGKLIEDIDFSREGTYEVRAKGILDLHGVKQERILKGTLKVGNEEVTLSSEFVILLEDHNIKVPRVVYQKISPDINVTINAIMKPLQQKG